MYVLTTPQMTTYKSRTIERIVGTATGLGTRKYNSVGGFSFMIFIKGRKNEQHAWEITFENVFFFLIFVSRHKKIHVLM